MCSTQRDGGEEQGSQGCRDSQEGLCTGTPDGDTADPSGQPSLPSSCHAAMPLLSSLLQSVAGSGRDPLRKREGHGRRTWQPQPW